MNKTKNKSFSTPDKIITAQFNQSLKLNKDSIKKKSLLHS